MSNDEDSLGVHGRINEQQERKPKSVPVPSCVKLEHNDSNVKCSLCLKSDYDPLSYGDLYLCGNVVAHYFCLLLSSSLVQNGEDHEGILGFFPKDIKRKFEEDLDCYCRKTGATIGCHLKACKRTFHLPCGLKNGSMHQFFNQFLSFCSRHRLSQQVDPKYLHATEEDEDALSCPICYEPVSNKSSNQTLWAPCCKRDGFTEFVYKDAAWEREPGAFQDLLHSYRRCDARICKCPDGRDFSQNIGSWRLLRCNACGSQGTHVVCSALKLVAASSSWRCPMCANVISKVNLGFAREEKVSRIPSESSPNSRLSSTYANISTISSNSSETSSSSSSQRRRADVLLEGQAIKRRRPSDQVPDLGCASTSLCGDINHGSSSPEVPVHVKTSESDEEDIVIVDESSSDIEVLDEVCVSSAELLTNDGKKIKIHKFTAGTDTVPEEIGKLGAVNSECRNYISSSFASLAKSPAKPSNSVKSEIMQNKSSPCLQSNQSTSEQSLASTSKVSNKVEATTVRFPNITTPFHPPVPMVPLSHNGMTFGSTLPVPQQIYYIPVTIGGQVAMQPVVPLPQYPTQQLISRHQPQQVWRQQEVQEPSQERVQSSPDIVCLD